MLTKLFDRKKIKQSRAPIEQVPLDDRDMTLRIIHAGGVVECYYMAVPAVRIMEKYPRLVLARPEIFRRPFESIVCPEEILIPGQKFYFVPRRTVRMLQKRMKRLSVGLKTDSKMESKSESERARPKESEMNMRKPVAQLKKKVRFVDIWQPSLMSIDETSPKSVESEGHS